LLVDKKLYYNLKAIINKKTQTTRLDFLFKENDALKEGKVLLHLGRAKRRD